MSGFGILAALGWASLLVIDLVLVTLAFQTNAGLGIMTLFMPFYAVTTGNWRLKTERRKTWALAWWAALLFSVVCLILSR